MHLLALGAVLVVTHAPPAATYSHSAVVAWRTGPALVTTCQLDLRQPRLCHGRLRLSGLKAGRHTVVIRARTRGSGRVLARAVVRWNVGVRVLPTWRVDYTDPAPPYGWATASALPANHPDSLQILGAYDDNGTEVLPVDGPRMALFRVYPDSAPRPGDVATHRARALLTNGNAGGSNDLGVDHSGGRPGQTSWYRFSDYWPYHINPNPQGWNIVDQFHSIGGGETANVNVAVDGDTGMARLAMHGGEPDVARQWELGTIPPFQGSHGAWWTFVLGVHWSPGTDGWVDLYLDRHDGKGFVHLIQQTATPTQYPVSADVPHAGVFASTGYYRGPFGGLRKNAGPYTGTRVPGDEPGVSQVLHGPFARYPANPLPFH